MPTFRLNVTVQQKGMIFSASATQAAGARATTAMNELLATEAVKRIKERLGQVLKHPTGFYESRIVVQSSGVARYASDSGVIYGGWLEGVSSRNKTTRFKGYSTFRLVKQSINQDKVKIAQPAINAYVAELNK